MCSCAARHRRIGLFAQRCDLGEQVEARNLPQRLGGEVFGHDFGLAADQTPRKVFERPPALADSLAGVVFLDLRLPQLLVGADLAAEDVRHARNLVNRGFGAGSGLVQRRKRLCDVVEREELDHVRERSALAGDCLQVWHADEDVFVAVEKATDALHAVVVDPGGAKRVGQPVDSLRLAVKLVGQRRVLHEVRGGHQCLVAQCSVGRLRAGEEAFEPERVVGLV